MLPCLLIAFHKTVDCCLNNDERPSFDGKHEALLSLILKTTNAHYLQLKGKVVGQVHATVGSIPCCGSGSYVPVISSSHNKKLLTRP